MAMMTKSGGAVRRWPFLLRWACTQGKGETQQPNSAPQAAQTEDSSSLPVESVKDQTKDAASDATGNRNGMPKEIGGPPGPEPTRYGDWEKGGRCSDF